KVHGIEGVKIHSPPLCISRPEIRITRVDIERITVVDNRLQLANVGLVHRWFVIKAQMIRRGEGIRKSHRGQHILERLAGCGIKELEVAFEMTLLETRACNKGVVLTAYTQVETGTVVLIVARIAIGERLIKFSYTIIDIIDITGNIVEVPSEIVI